MDKQLTIYEYKLTNIDEYNLNFVIRYPKDNLKSLMMCKYLA